MDPETEKEKPRQDDIQDEAVQSETPDPPEESSALTGEDTTAEEEIEEEVILDEVSVEEEEHVEPEGPEESEENGLKEGGTGEESTGSPETPPEKEQNKEGMLAFLRKKWVLVSAGSLLLVLGLVVGSGFFPGQLGRLLHLGALLGIETGEKQALVQTVLRPFFIPLPATSGNLAVKLVISVQWSPEVVILYRKNQVQIRNEVYQYLLRAARSGRNFDEKKSDLGSELDRVFEHALALRDIDVRVDEITRI